MDWAPNFALIAAGLHLLLGLGVTIRGADSVAKRAFAGGMILFAVENFFVALSLMGESVDEKISWERWRMVSMSGLPILWFLFSENYSRKSERQYLSPKALLLGTFCLLLFFTAVLLPQTVLQARTNGLLEGQIVLEVLSGGYFLLIAILLSGILVLMNLERTFRASVGIMRWRIKYMILGVGTIWVIRIYTSAQSLLYKSLPESMDALNAAASILGCLLIGRAMIRSGHFNVDVYPSEAVLRNSITAIVAGVYLVIVGVLAKVVTYFGATSQFPLRAFVVLVALVVLAMLLLSDQVQDVTKRFVSRHFQRPVHDYRKIWASFTRETVSVTDVTSYCEKIVELIAENFQVLSSTVLLIDRDETNLSFGASTQILKRDFDRVSSSDDDIKKLVDDLKKHDAVVDLETEKSDWVGALKSLNPDFFEKGGGRICIPLIAGDHLLGLILLGDRVRGVRFSEEDHDLLNSVADHIAVTLLNLELSRELLEAREMEAFQTMSSFFVHDLKNTASTLSLMLRNLRTHFEDPSFREDALKAVSSSVKRINGLIERLGMMRETLKLAPKLSDLNDLVEEVVNGLDSATRGKIETVFEFSEPVRIDAEQIQKVLTNLVINARDAIGSDGRIEISTSQKNEWAVLSVKDDGTGIDPEFLKNSLFRPFQTTKKSGTGIGIFHCKKIVEAHEGKIEVESELGKGTEFRVLLPMKGKRN